MSDLATELQPGAQGVPFLVVGEEIFVGYGEGTTGEAILAEVARCGTEACINPAVEYLLENEYISQEEYQNEIDAAQLLIDENLVSGVEDDGDNVEAHDTNEEEDRLIDSGDDKAIELPFGIKIHPSDVSL
ncbi:MAG: hypothetical protein K8S14_06395, partial [Actinomycetia bacterium]|nr:hypothetical protein [Actinomycetes bacterium]